MRTLGVSLAVLVLLAFACQCTRDIAPPTATGGQVVAGSTEPSKDMRRAAILSVYFHAHDISSDRLPAELQPIDLGQAAQVLRAATDRLAEARRRRAIARLAVAGLDDRDRCAAVQTLLGGPIAPLVEILNQLALEGAAPGREPAAAKSPAASSCPAAHVQLTLPPNKAIAAIAARLAQVLGAAIADCPYEYHPAVTTFDGQSQKTTAVVETAVQRDVAAVCGVMDPQNWDENQCSDFFSETYIAKKTGNDYVVGRDFGVAEDPNPPPPCTTYERDALFEHFDATFKNPYGNPYVLIVTAWYRNLLRIDSHSLPVDQSNPTGGHLYGYTLFRSLGSRVYFDTRPGGMDCDEGAISIHERVSDPSWTEIHVTKTLRFADRPVIDKQLNYEARFFLEAMADELPEMACCQ